MNRRFLPIILLLFCSALATVAKTKGSLAGATLQIHEAVERHSAGHMHDYYRKRQTLRLFSISPLGPPGAQTLVGWGRDKWGGGNFLIFIKSSCLFQ